MDSKTLKYLGWGVSVAIVLFLLGKSLSKVGLSQGINKPQDPDTIDPSFAKKNNFHLIPDKLNNYRSKQMSLKDMEYAIKKYGIKNIIRMNGDGTDTWNGVTRKEEEALCKKLGCNYTFLDSHKGYKYNKGYLESMNKAHTIMRQGNTLVHCNHGADRTGYIVASFLKRMGIEKDPQKLWNYTVKYNLWDDMVKRRKFYGTGFDKYADGFFPLDELKKVYKP